MKIAKISHVLLYIYVCSINIYSQNIENKDSAKNEIILKDIVNSIKENKFSTSDTSVLINNISLEIFKTNFSASSLIITPLIERNILSPFIPYSYSLDSFYESLIIKGIYGIFSLTEYLTANINLYLSRLYFSNIQVDPYINGSLKAELIFKLHDRIQLIGIGQISLREGFNPKFSSITGGANYYGTGMQFKITNKVGVRVEVTNNYYHGEWTKRNYAVPVIY
jgi:hypothetical protein